VFGDGSTHSVRWLITSTSSRNAQKRLDGLQASGRIFGGTRIYLSFFQGNFSLKEFCNNSQCEIGGG